MLRMKHDGAVPQCGADNMSARSVSGGIVRRAKGPSPYQPGAAPQVIGVEKNKGLKARPIAHAFVHGSGFQPSGHLHHAPWGVAPGWYGLRRWRAIQFASAYRDPPLLSTRGVSSAADADCIVSAAAMAAENRSGEISAVTRAMSRFGSANSDDRDRGRTQGGGRRTLARRGLREK